MEKIKATNSSILAWRIPWIVWGHKESDTLEQLSLSPLELWIDGQIDGWRWGIHMDRLINRCMGLIYKWMSEWVGELMTRWICD